MTTLDLYAIIDEFSDAAYERCKNFLFGALNFEVLSRDQVRRIDFKEKIAGFFSAKGYSKTDIEKLYAKIADGIILRYVSIKGDRGIKYDNRRKALSSQLLNGGCSADKVLDYAFIFIQECWDFTEAKNYEGHYNTTMDSFSCDPDDFTTVLRLFNDVTKYNYYDTTNPIIGRKKEELYVHTLSADEKKYLCILNAIFLTRLLQAGGEY